MAVEEGREKCTASAIYAAPLIMSAEDCPDPQVQAHDDEKTSPIVPPPARGTRSVQRV